MYSIIPKKPDNVPSDYNCGKGSTIPMLLASNGIVPS